MYKIQVQLKRLKDNYSRSVYTYDYVSFLDLAHTLRIWTELKSVLPELNKDLEIKKPFKTGSPVRKLMKQARGQIYIFSYLPSEGVTTYASNGILASSPHVNDGGSVTMGVKAKNTGNSILLSQYCFISKSLEQPYITAVDKKNVTRCNYKNWMGSEIVRLQYKNSKSVLEKHSITREMIIKRIANNFDASHTSLGEKGSSNNKFDEPIQWLMKFTCGGLPLPYFLLLKIAQDILKFIPPLLPKKEAV